MRIVANRESLLNAMSAVWSVVPTRSPKPILQNVKIVATEDDGTTLLATDLDIGITRLVPGVRVDRPGAAILSARVLAILKASPDADISIEVDGDLIRVKGASSSYKLTAENPDLFPTPNEFTATDYHVVGSGPLKAAIKRTIFATDPESAKYALGGILWEFPGDRMTLVATDGRCLAEAIIDAETEGSPKEYLNGSDAPIIPMKAAKLLEKLLDDDGPPVHICVICKHAVLIRTENETIYSRIVEGRFPRYQDVFPAESAEKFAMPAANLLGGLTQAAIATSEESRGVDLYFGDDMISLKGLAADVGESAIEIPYGGGGGDTAVTFDPQYLIPMLRNLPEDASVDVALGGDSATVFTYNGSYRYAAMPLTRGQ